MSGNRYLLDTNAVIAFQNQDQHIHQLLAVATEIFIPVIVVGELFFGAYRSQRSQKNVAILKSYLYQRNILQVDYQSAYIYGEVKNKLRAKGRPIPENDIWIAALAMQYSLTLVTNDKHFTEVDQLITQGW